MAVQNRRYINKMRQDAIRRSREMSGPMLGSADSDIPPDRLKSNISDSGEKISDQSKQPSKNPLGGIIDEIFGGALDSDKLLIAAILLMLMKEGGDKRLILALGYILM